MFVAHPLGYVCRRSPVSLEIDGRLDKAEWAIADWTTDFVDIEGDIRPKPRFRTRAKMLWDDQYFYIGAELEEPHIWATLTEHDSVIFHDNDFEVFIDPDGDNHNYYEFEINALNTGWDLRLVMPYRDGGPALNEWEIPGLKTAVWIDGTLNNPSDIDRKWTVEIAMPWAVLDEFARHSGAPHEGEVWRVNFSRVEWEITHEPTGYAKVPNKPEDNWVWSPQGVINMHCPEHWGYVQFTHSNASNLACPTDPTHSARMNLISVYHAQKTYHKQHGKWAETLSKLQWFPVLLDVNLGIMEMETTAEGFIAKLWLLNDSPNRTYLWIKQDSQLGTSTLE